MAPRNCALSFCATMVAKFTWHSLAPSGRIALAGSFPGLKPWAEFYSPFGASASGLGMTVVKQIRPLETEGRLVFGITRLKLGYGFSGGSSVIHTAKRHAPKGRQNSAQGFNPGTAHPQHAPRRGDRPNLLTTQKCVQLWHLAIALSHFAQRWLRNSPGILSPLQGASLWLGQSQG